MLYYPYQIIDDAFEIISILRFMKPEVAILYFYEFFVCHIFSYGGSLQKITKIVPDNLYWRVNAEMPFGKWIGEGGLSLSL